MWLEALGDVRKHMRAVIGQRAMVSEWAARLQCAEVP